MIGKLSGIIDSFGDKYLLLDVQGVGYVVHASRRTLTRIGQVGDAASLLTDMQVREDSMTLYGFIDAAEQQWFRLLNSVQGVGAKVALGILSVCPPERLSVIIAAQDKAGITQADGVGPKLATRILTELKDKAAAIAVEFPVSDGAVPKPSAAPVESAPDTASVDVPANLDEDALSALINLGYARADAYSAIMQAKLKANDNYDLQNIIRLALKELSA